MTDTENTAGQPDEDGDLTVAELARRLGRTPEQVRNHADNLEAAIVGFQSYRTTGGSVLTRNAVKRITRTVKAAREIAALETSATEQAPATLPQGITVQNLAQELHQPVSTTAAQARAYSEATGQDPYQDSYPWRRLRRVGDWVLTPQAAQWIRRPLRESEPPPTAGFTSYYGPTAWDEDARKQWHRECPDTEGSGHGGEVWYWKDGSATCLGCGQEHPDATAQLSTSGPCSVPGQPREAAQAASPDLEDVAELLVRLELTVADEGCNLWRPGTDSPDTSQQDQKIMAWAIRTAGHRFDPHTLWDYDLVTDAEHVHRCITHRHVGPNTRGPVRRG